MKTSLTLLTLTITTSVLVACNGAEGTKVEQTGEKVSKSNGEKSDDNGKKGLSFKINEAVKLGDYVITVTKFVDNVPAPDEFSAPQSGKKFVAIEVLYENRTNDKQIDAGPADWKLIDGDSYSYDADIMEEAKTPGLSFGTVNPGQKSKGWITFQATKEAKNFKVQFIPDVFENENVEIVLE